MSRTAGEFNDVHKEKTNQLRKLYMLRACIVILLTCYVYVTSLYRHVTCRPFVSSLYHHFTCISRHSIIISRVGLFLITVLTIDLWLIFIWFFFTLILKIHLPSIKCMNAMLMIFIFQSKLDVDARDASSKAFKAYRQNMETVRI